MSDSVPGFTAIKETEEVQLWASGPDNQHKRFLQKIKLKSSITDSGNTNNTTTIRGGRVIGLRDADGLGYLYDADATNGDQKVVGILPKHISMLDHFGTAEDKFTSLLTAGIIKNVSDLLGADKAAIAVLARIGFTFAQLDPHGSCFLLHPKARYFKSADYTLVDGDHGCMFIATGAVNFTLPDLATVGKGYSVLLYQASDNNMVITGAANTIVTGDAGGALSTTITFSTANAKMGGHALMYADYISDGGALGWYALMVGRTPTTA